MTAGILGLFTGSSTIVTGVEDDPSGMVRMYVGARWRGIYALIEDPVDQQTLRRAWEDSTVKLIVPMPDADQLHQDDR